MSRYTLTTTCFLVAAIIALVIAFDMVHQKYITARDNYFRAQNNYEALIMTTDSLKDNNRVFQLTIDELNHSNDSILQEMNKIRKELRIKNKDLERLSYLESQASKVDTLIFRDSIFVNNVAIDTTLSDSPWYECNISLRSPNIVAINPKFTSQKYVVTHVSKVTVKPPKKWKVLRAFQKKRTVVETEVVEMNKYITNTKDVFLEVLR